MTSLYDEKRYEMLYDHVKKFHQDASRGQLDMQMVIILARYAMELVQTGKEWKNMHGSEKKMLVVAVINAVVKDVLQDDQVSGQLDPTIKTAILAALALLPSVIDAIIDYSKLYKPQNKKPWYSKLACCTK